MADELPDNAKDITPDDSIVPVFLVPLTADEEAEREQWAADEQARIDAETKAEADKTAARESVMAKLAKLGLTADEVNALVPA